MKTFIPSLYGPPSPCGLNTTAQNFVHYWQKALGPRASLYRCDSRLVAVAQAHAEWLGLYYVEGGPILHFGEGGSTPNQRVRRGGYRLPGWQGDGNTVESGTENWDSPADALIAFLGSPPHRVHLLGEGDFSPNIFYGVGYSKDFYIVLAAPMEGE